MDLSMEMQESRIAEFIMRGLLADDHEGSLHKLRKKILFRARERLRGRTLFSRYRLFSQELLIPLDHDLPLWRKTYPHYAKNVGRICRYIGDKYPGFQMIDIGANIGDTVAVIREESECPILCIEGDPFFFGVLQENIRRGQYKSVKAVQALVSTQTGELKGQLVSSSGSAHFTENGKSPIESTSLSDLLSRFPEFDNLRLLKIDTDGLDCSILWSEFEWLAKCKLPVFFEYEPFRFVNHGYDDARIFKDLAQAGYRYAVFYDNSGDYLLSLDLLQDFRIVEDLQVYYLGRQGFSFMDVLLLQEQDHDLATDIREKEVRWSAGSRKHVGFGRPL
jgi:FkbM family methyltransferase